MDSNDFKVLYVNKMTQADHESMHVMFEDGSMVRVHVASNASSDYQNPLAAADFFQKIEQLLNQYNLSEEEVYPICLGDVPCMYCNGKGCINCRREQA